MVVSVSETSLYCRIVWKGKLAPLLMPQTKVVWRYSWFYIPSMTTSTHTVAGYKCNIERTRRTDMQVALQSSSPLTSSPMRDMFLLTSLPREMSLPRDMSLRTSLSMEMFPLLTSPLRDIHREENTGCMKVS